MSGLPTMPDSTLVWTTQCHDSKKHTKLYAQRVYITKPDVWRTYVMTSQCLPSLAFLSWTSQGISS